MFKGDICWGASQEQSELVGERAPRARKDGHSTKPVGGIFKTPWAKFYFYVWAIIQEREIHSRPSIHGASYKKRKHLLVPYLK